MTATWHLLYLVSCRDLLVKTSFHPLNYNPGTDCRFCIVDPECWGLKLETLMKMFGCNMPAWREFSYLYAWKQKPFFRWCFAHWLGFRTTLGLWQEAKQRMALDRQVFALPTVWPFHVAQQIGGQNHKKLPVQECWGQKLETLMKMFGCNMPAWREFSYLYAWKQKPFFRWCFAHWLGFRPTLGLWQETKQRIQQIRGQNR